MDTDKSKCLEEPSKFSSHKSMCYWDEEKELAVGHNDTRSSYCFHSEYQDRVRMAASKSIAHNLLGTYASDWNKFLAFCYLLKIVAINVPSI